VPSNTPEVETVKTDAAGDWKAIHKPTNPAFTGAWTVKAEFAGDATRRASSSSTCQIEYLP